MYRSQLLFTLVLTSSFLHSAEAPQLKRWTPPTPREAYISEFKARITPLEVDASPNETDGIVTSRQYFLSAEPHKVVVVKNEKTRKAYLLSTLSQVPKSRISDESEEIRSTASSENCMNFFVSRKHHAASPEKKNSIKRINVFDGTVSNFPIPTQIPSDIHSMIYDEANNVYYLAGQSQGCDNNASYLFRFNPHDSKCPYKTLIQVSPSTDNTTSMHLDAQNNLVTTHRNGKVRHWTQESSQTLHDFNLARNNLNIAPIISDLSADKQKMFIAITKSMNSFDARLLSWIKVHDFYNPEQRDEFVQTYPELVITDLKAIRNDQLVCANLKLPNSMPATAADYKAFQRGPHTCIIELWDTRAKTKLLQFKLSERITHLAANDNNQRLLIQANTSEVRMPSFKILDAMPESKARALLKLAKSSARTCLDFEGKPALFHAATADTAKILLPSLDIEDCWQMYEPHEIEMILDAQERECEEKKPVDSESLDLKAFEEMMQKNIEAVQASELKEQ